MSKHKIREDKTCLNCGAYVEKEYCPECGQRNTESRESIKGLFGEFISDFVHYDSSFWKTTKYLLFRPGKLSTEYMSGKRKSFVHPVKLYIFISFLAFFIPSILPSDINNGANTQGSITITHNDDPIDSSDIKILAKLDTIMLDSNQKKTDTIPKDVLISKLKDYGYIYSIEQFDSIHKALPKDKRLSFSKYHSYRTAIKLKEKKDNREYINSFIEHNISKAIFLYMPIFAFLLWLFHFRRYYFDSGIFTLHFFSFYLLVISLYNIASYFTLTLLHWGNFSDMLLAFSILWTIYYFFRAHYKFYNEKKGKSIVKSIVFFIVNSVLILFFFVAYILTPFILL